MKTNKNVKKNTILPYLLDRALIVLYSVIILSLIFFLSRYFINSFNYFLTALGFSTNFNSIFFYNLTLLFLIIAVFKYSIGKLRKESKLDKFLKKFNVYFMIALYLSFLFTFYGYYFLTAHYGRALPIEDLKLIPHEGEIVQKIVASSLNKTPTLTCVSGSGKTEFIFNDMIYCTINMFYKLNSSYTTTMLFVRKNILNGSEEPIADRVHPDNKYAISFKTKLDNYESYSMYVSLGLANETMGYNDIATHWININLNILSMEEYRERKEKKLALIVTLLSIVTFAVFGTMRNIKSLLKD